MAGLGHQDQRCMTGLWALWEDLTFLSRGLTVQLQPQTPFGKAVEWPIGSAPAGQVYLLEWA